MVRNNLADLFQVLTTVGPHFGKGSAVKIRAKDTVGVITKSRAQSTECAVLWQIAPQPQDLLLWETITLEFSVLANLVTGIGKDPVHESRLSHPRMSGNEGYS